MIRSRWLKNISLFGILCCFLLLLNNLFTVRDESSIANSNAVVPQCPVAITSSANIAEVAACTADGGKPMKCLKSDDEYYFPFSVIKKQFGVSGRKGKDAFEWQTSYAKVRVPEGKVYNSSGVFGHFATYNVENRERVRCISASTGVPMSTQWDTVPYYYPIQIAQYGLQHYSRMVQGNESKTRAVYVGTATKEWKGSPGESETSERVFYRDEEYGNLVNISSPDNVVSPGAYLFLDPDPELNIVSFGWKPMANASFTILARVIATDKLILLNYMGGENRSCVSVDGDGKSSDEQISFSYWLGDSPAVWTNVTRDVSVDAARAMSSLNTVKRKEGNVIYHPGDLKLVTLGFHGNSVIQQRILQANEAHRQFFLVAADWLVGNQDAMGGWPVPVERAIADRRLVLPVGWHSAMAQGHALSLLTRAFLETEETSYLEAATRALILFEKPAAEGGIVNDFLGHPWFEEYPTTPGSFVLNGFMYSLIGLYDFSVLPANLKSSNKTVTSAAAKASKFFDLGLSSLHRLLPLYDTGSGSIYDLRHFGLKTAPNLARWDYHAVHVYLLKWLVQITSSKELNETAERWIGYSYGKKAKHN